MAVARGPSLAGRLFSTGFFLFAAFVLSNVVNGVGNPFGGASSGSGRGGMLGPGVSVAQISVALEVPDRDAPNSILSALERLSATAQTDSRVGLQELTSQVAMELLRRKSSVVAACARGAHHRDGDAARREYDGVAVRERGKFESEAVSRYGGVASAARSPGSDRVRASP